MTVPLLQIENLEAAYGEAQVLFDVSLTIEPGEVVAIDSNGVTSLFNVASPQHRFCIFEYVYFARPDSIIDDIFVHKARLRMGKKLARKILQDWPDAATWNTFGTDGISPDDVEANSVADDVLEQATVVETFEEAKESI